MFLRKMKVNSLRRKWKVFFGPTKDKGTAVATIEQSFLKKRVNDRYVVFEPLVLQELAPASYDYKLYLDGYTVRKRRLKSINMAMDVLLNGYRKLFKILAQDPDINTNYIDNSEFKWLSEQLKNSLDGQIILEKIRRIREGI